MNQHKDSPRDTLEAVRCCDAFHAVDAATRVAECGACGQRWHVAAPETGALTVEAVAADVVAVANMRHLWILAEPPAFTWRSGA